MGHTGLFPTPYCQQVSFRLLRLGCHPHFRGDCASAIASCGDAMGRLRPHGIETAHKAQHSEWDCDGAQERGEWGGTAPFGWGKNDPNLT